MSWVLYDAVAVKSKPNCDTLLPLPVQSPPRLDDMFADDMSDDVDITHQCVAVSSYCAHCFLSATLIC